VHTLSLQDVLPTFGDRPVAVDRRHAGPPPDAVSLVGDRVARARLERRAVRVRAAVERVGVALEEVVAPPAGAEVVREEVEDGEGLVRGGAGGRGWVASVRDV